MTIDKLLSAYKDIIENSPYSELDGVPVYLSQEPSVVDYPCIKVIDQGSEEHETLRGVLTVTVNISLHSVIAESADDGTTDTAHKAIYEKLYCLLGNIVAIDDSNDFTGLKVFDIRLASMLNEREDGRNTATITQEVVCCPDN